MKKECRHLITSLKAKLKKISEEPENACRDAQQLVAARAMVECVKAFNGRKKAWQNFIDAFDGYLVLELLCKKYGDAKFDFVDKSIGVLLAQQIDTQVFDAEKLVVLAHQMFTTEERRA